MISNAEIFGSRSLLLGGTPQRFAWREIVSEHGLACLTGGVLAASIALGGATRNGYPGDVLLQFLAIILLIAALRDIVLSGSVRHFKWPLIFLGSLALVPMVQLLPLPAELWSRLPGRAIILQTYALIGQPRPAFPLSLTPSATYLSGLALLPPAAVFLGTLTLGYAHRRSVSFVLIAMGIVSVLLGLLQLAQGPNSALRFYEITNKTEAVGFFANRNHFAALLYVATLFVAAHLIDAIGIMGQRTPRRRADANVAVPLLTWLTALLMLTAAQLMARSRAGLVLTDLALAATIAVGMTDRRIATSNPGFGRLIVGTAAGIILLLLPLALYRILDRFGADPFADARISFARKTISAALQYMPFGSGLGSFVPVYQLYEKTSDLGLTYANHAHNDILEVWLETGIFGIALMGVFGVWIVRRTNSLWNDGSGVIHGIDLGLARAASVAVFLLLAHSFVDYPLRTTAMMTVAAVALAFLIKPAKLLGRQNLRHGTRRRPRNSSQQGSPPAHDPLPGGSNDGSSQLPSAREVWVPRGEWPEAWRPVAAPSRPRIPAQPDDATTFAEHLERDRAG
ncbi:O-antigen ligase [Hyphomicrobium sp. ghe19]|uniref:O-antigen ligase family protein n=1 Tax=Hyphomicrobium sp. ghe19 TaxID=2682968 RepID=UPI00136690BE|nr:hypothetical protein HYPP_03130 [Hyphomicrobium sp. ghe19]